MIGTIIIMLITFALSVVVTKAVVGKIIKGDWWDITWWQAFLIVVITMVIMWLLGALLSPLALIGG